jgi:ADP-ribosylglycohydrolase
MDQQKADHIRGCMLGGAIGDALGGPIEFYSISQIRQKFGPTGVTSFYDYQKAGLSGIGHFTDDTQMTLFTAEGLLRAECRGREKGICDPATMVYHAYLRWLHTQGERVHVSGNAIETKDDGWLIGIPELHHRRAPGNTCLFALQSGKMGTLLEAINQSKGCGGIMRAAPAGLFSVGHDPCILGMETAAITHGHPSGYLAAGCLAQMVSDLLDGDPLDSTVDHILHILRDRPDSTECV